MKPEEFLLIMLGMTLGVGLLELERERNADASDQLGN
jgi:hypothetical protein